MDAPLSLELLLRYTLAIPTKLILTVAHYPSCASTWNPIELRLFSELSRNWAGIPLESMDVMWNYRRTMTPQTGLTVTAKSIQKDF